MGFVNAFFEKNFNFFSKIFSFSEFIAAASIVFCYPVQVDQLNSRRHFYSLGQYRMSDTVYTVMKACGSSRFI